MLILLIAILTFSISYYSIQPIIEEKCKDIAISISSEFASIEVQKMAMSKISIPVIILFFFLAWNLLFLLPA